MILQHVNTTDWPLSYKHAGDSGFDIRSKDKHIIPPRGQTTIATGLYFSVPEGYELQIRSRSGLADKNGVFVLNSPGTVDSGYRGEVKVILQNTHKYHWFYVNPGDRIAQAVLCPVLRAEFSAVDSLDETTRGEGGLGSTGVT